MELHKFLALILTIAWFRVISLSMTISKNAMHLPSHTLKVTGKATKKIGIVFVSSALSGIRKAFHWILKSIILVFKFQVYVIKRAIIKTWKFYFLGVSLLWNACKNQTFFRVLVNFILSTIHEAADNVSLYFDSINQNWITIRQSSRNTACSADTNLNKIVANHKVALKVVSKVMIKSLRVSFFLFKRAFVAFWLSVAILTWIFANHVPYQKITLPFSFVFEPCGPDITNRFPSHLRCSFPAANVSLVDHPQINKYLDYSLSVNMELRNDPSIVEIGMFVICVTMFAQEQTIEQLSPKSSVEACRSQAIAPTIVDLNSRPVGFDFGFIDNMFEVEKVQVMLKNSFIQVLSSNVELSTELAFWHHVFNPWKLPLGIATLCICCFIAFVLILLSDLILMIKKKL